jgi:DNA-binding XRE family transcriptional regulator
LGSAAFKINIMNLKQYRNSLGITQKQMSEAINIAQPSLARSEKNWPNVSLDFLQKITEAFGAQIVIDGDGCAISNYPRIQEDIVEDIIL